MLFRRNDSAQGRLRLKLKKSRMEAGLTQAQVARMLGRPQSFISKVESGDQRFDFLMLQVLARIYGKSLLTTRTHPLRSCSPQHRPSERFSDGR